MRRCHPIRLGWRPSRDHGGVSAVEIFGEEQVVRASRYHRPLYAAAIANLALDVLVLTLIVFGPLADQLFEPLKGWPWWAQVVGYTAIVLACMALFGLPISVWAGFLHERSWGFSTQDLSGYAADRAKGFALGLVLSGAALLALVGSARLLPRLWPLIACLAGALLVLALGLLAPLVIEPLFNRFDPLEDTELATELRALADRAQLPIKEVLVTDASRRTRKSNAYVSGLGPTRRLVLYDTLLARASRAEIGLVLAHELGHRRARHLLKGALLTIVGLAGFVIVLWALLRWPGLRTAIGAPDGAGDPRVVPFVILLGTALQIVVSPLGSALSRRWERTADSFSLELTGNLATFESTHRSLATDNLSDLDPPRPIYLAFFSHPTPVERIETARRQSRSNAQGATAHA
jgi:STE24 endopeptidase